MQVVRSALMGVACEFVRLSPEVHAFVQKWPDSFLMPMSRVWLEPRAVRTARTTLLPPRVKALRQQCCRRLINGVEPHLTTYLKPSKACPISEILDMFLPALS